MNYQPGDIRIGANSKRITAKSEARWLVVFTGLNSMERRAEAARARKQ